MARKTFEEINAILDAAIAAGRMWNVDFEDIKRTIQAHIEARVDNCPEATELYRLLSAENDAAYETFLAGKGLVSRLLHYDQSRALYEEFKKTKAYSNSASLVYSVRTANIKVLLNYCRKAEEGKLTQDPRWDAFLARLAEIKPFLEKVEKVKTMLVKGRKVDPNAAPAPVRTLDHTGTCGCCKRNVKLTQEGLIWTHGYQQDFHFGRTKDCFGTGYQPIEVSPDVLHAMLRSCESRVANLPKSIDEQKKLIAANPRIPGQWAKGTPEFEHNRKSIALASELRQMEDELSHLTNSAIPRLHKEISNWVLRSLPGTKP